ncbi:germination protein M [Gracilibacillus halotolerans]|uniref:Germination protein M n=1 Tax=Gracilibacillus halotolerans TaxID=74386 RepID=A0A841RMS0_9BACI|nr:GerMN domain-containing protein [Gracilibacillus halotolerans]MBB6511988.1 germination protein M [Gracilibacillus halotolerans]
MKKISRLPFLTIVLIGMLLLSACGMFKGEQETMEDMDPPPEQANLVDDLESITDGESEGSDEEGTEEEEEENMESETTGEPVTRTLYLLDQNGLVVPVEVDLPAPSNKEVARQVVEYLVEDGPISSILPNGFQAVLPSGTDVISLNLDESGTLVLDLSEEFANYEAENEKKILEAMTFTLTQFENVNNIKIWINGQEQQTMPVNGTPLTEGYSRANGINVHVADAVDFMESKAATLYFPMQANNEEVYFVPVTQHVPLNQDNELHSIVQALLEGPAFDLPLEKYINTGAQLASEPLLNSDGTLSLQFNENILANSEKGVIADEVMESIVLTMTELENVEAIEVSAGEHKAVISESGQAYEEPVTREMASPKESI